jgi:hypothetical protein
LPGLHRVTHGCHHNCVSTNMVPKMPFFTFIVEAFFFGASARADAPWDVQPVGTPISAKNLRFYGVWGRQPPQLC